MRKGYALTASLLSALSHVMDRLSTSQSLALSPAAYVAATILLNVEASFSPGFGPPLLALTFGFLMSTWARKVFEWLLVTSSSALLAAVVSLPALIGGAPSAQLFILRTASAAAISASAFAVLGWYGFLQGLEALRVPNGLIRELAIAVRFIPLFARKAVRMLAAREARLFNPTPASARAVVGSVAGDLLLAGYRKGKALRLAIEARTLGLSHCRSSVRLKPGDAVLFLAATLSTYLFLTGV